LTWENSRVFVWGNSNYLKASISGVALSRKSTTGVIVMFVCYSWKN